jgi:hypothetical protein
VGGKHSAISGQQEAFGISIQQSAISISKRQRALTETQNSYIQNPKAKYQKPKT